MDKREYTEPCGYEQEQIHWLNKQIEERDEIIFLLCKAIEEKGLDSIITNISDNGYAVRGIYHNILGKKYKEVEDKLDSLFIEETELKVALEVIKNKLNYE
jgi:hypothetical protein